MISVIIVNYNTVQMTLDCLESIFQYTRNVNFEVIVIDNASIDSSVSSIRSRFPEVVLLELSDNLGFGKANNRGAAVAKGDFLFFLNSDTFFIENSLEMMYSFFIRNEKQLNIGVLGSIMVDAKLDVNGFGSKFPKPIDFYTNFARRIPLIGRSFHKPEPKHNLSKLFFEIDYVLGADMLMRKSVFDSFGGFNPGYFMYYEESDLQFAIAKAGYKNYVFTGTKIVHLEGGSFGEKKIVSNNKRIIVHSSKLRYIKRNFPKEYKLFKIFDFIVLLVNTASFRYSFKENLTYFTNIIKEY